MKSVIKKESKNYNYKQVRLEIRRLLYIDVDDVK